LDPAFTARLEEALRGDRVRAGLRALLHLPLGRPLGAAAAAMTGAGYSRCFNVAGGFEGMRDDAGHRGTIDGWKAANLPWLQS
jgi:rhodanese-related sulfurtransferase